MELQGGIGHSLQRLLQLISRGIDQQHNRHDVGGQTPRQLTSACGTHMTGTLFINNKTDGIGARFHGGVHIGFTGQAADLDPGAVFRG